MGEPDKVDNTVAWLEAHGYQIAYGVAAALAALLLVGIFFWHWSLGTLLLPALIVVTTLLIRWRSELWVFFVPAAVLVAIVFAGMTVEHGLLFCSEPTIGLPLPSEKSISGDILRMPIDPEHPDPVWLFRHAATGTEGRAGIPYWIFRVMPRLFDKEMNHQGYRFFGFDDDDGGPFYLRRAGDSADGTSFKMPRGTVLVDTGFDLPLFHFKVGLKRVALNCSACHRGKVLDKDGRPMLFDGMPNHTANLQAFKRFFSTAIDDPRFNADNVIAAIDQALADDGKPALTKGERLEYEAIVGVMKELGKDKTGKWQDSRPYNGPGRIDPFNAVKFEVLRVSDDGTVATLDFPSIWNQRGAMRQWHHYDGNTADSDARNYGSVIGVGGLSITVHKDTIDKVGDWIDKMKPPRYPFDDNSDGAAIERGKALFAQHCQGCHGLYDRESNQMIDKPAGFNAPHDMKTDGERLAAFNEGTAAALNNFGDRRQLWGPRAFRAAQHGYVSNALDGIWAKAPYLHNGSVPTLFHLLKPQTRRPATFCRGNAEYDAKLGGFRWEPKDGKCDRAEGLYDTTARGNLNTGHEIWKDPATRTELADQDCYDLIAYLKTL